MNDEQRGKQVPQGPERRSATIGPPPPRRDFMGPPEKHGAAERPPTSGSSAPDVAPVTASSEAPRTPPSQTQAQAQAQAPPPESDPAAAQPEHLAHTLRRQAREPMQDLRSTGRPSHHVQPEAPEEIPPEPTPLSWPQITHGDPTPPFAQTRPDARPPMAPDATQVQRPAPRANALAPSWRSEPTSGEQRPDWQMQRSSSADGFDEEEVTHVQSRHRGYAPAQNQEPRQYSSQTQRDAQALQNRVEQLLSAREAQAQQIQPAMRDPAQWSEATLSPEGEAKPAGCMRNLVLYVFLFFGFIMLSQFCNSL